MVLQNDADEWCRYLQVLAEIQEAKKEKLRGYCFFFGSSAILSIFFGSEKGNLKDGLVLFSLCIIIIMIFKIMLSSGSGGGKHGVSASGGCGGGGSIGCGGGGGCGGCGGGG